MALPCINYERPNGRPVPYEITNITPHDEQWFANRNISFTSETLSTGQHVFYADYGAKLSDGEPNEHVYIVPTGITCEQAMSNIRQAILILLNQKR